MIPKKYEFFVFGFFVSCFMSFLISGVISFINLGLVNNFASIWAEAFVKAWAVAYPSVLIVIPQVRKFLHLFIRND